MSLAADDTAGARSPALRRVLGTRLLVFYGLGVIIGAGIYVLVGSVVAAAGAAAPWSFLLAGLLAALTALSYAELAARFPEAAGAAAYVKEAFGSDRLSQAVGLAVAAVVVLSTASIARGAVGYVTPFVVLPDEVVSGGLVVLFTAVACLGVRESVGLAAAMTVLEIGGLLFVIAVGLPALETLPERAAELVPFADGDALAGIALGAFLAFFAFIGFENLANMAEEAADPERSLPRAILWSLAISTALYMAVALITVLALPLADIVAAPAPLLLVAARLQWFSMDLFAAVALVAVVNGVLIELVMLARLLYGMARRGWLPRGLARVSARVHTPVPATLAGGAIVLVFTVALPFVSLVSITSTVTLVIFAAPGPCAADGRVPRAARGPAACGCRQPRPCSDAGCRLTPGAIFGRLRCCSHRTPSRRATAPWPHPPPSGNWSRSCRPTSRATAG
jgi:APA family basic amino acid/polyamine antiporter